MRMLAACSLGGAGHFNPLSPCLAAATGREDDAVVAGPPAPKNSVDEPGYPGYPFDPCREPSEAEVAAIRKQLPVVPAAEASVLGDQELLGQPATRATYWAGFDEIQPSMWANR
jgi:hypothetical protein